MKRAAIYARVSTLDQNPETQLLELRRLVEQRGFQSVEEYIDRGVSGTRARRPALDRMMGDAARHRFDVVVVWAFDRMARSVHHLLTTLDELNALNIEFISAREGVDTSTPLGRAVTTIVGAIAELERNLIIERVKAGMRRAQFEGVRIGRRPAQFDREAVIEERRRGRSLTEIAKAHRISRALVSRTLKEANLTRHKGVATTSPQTADSADPESAA